MIDIDNLNKLQAPSGWTLGLAALTPGAWGGRDSRAENEWPLSPHWRDWSTQEPWQGDFAKYTFFAHEATPQVFVGPIISVFQGGFSNPITVYRPENNWIRIALAHFSAHQEQLALREVFTYVTLCKATGKVEDLEDDLRLVDVSSVPSLLLVALLRSTAAMRGKLPYWAAFLQNVKVELNARGQDAHVLLRGLGAES